MPSPKYKEFPLSQVLISVISFSLSVFLIVYIKKEYLLWKWFLTTVAALIGTYFSFKSIVIYFNFIGNWERNYLSKLRIYEKWHGEEAMKRVKKGVEMTVQYYDIVTDWYEFGWGQSFQLGGAQGFSGEPFLERCRRHEYWFANRAGITKGQKWLDLGCGVGGPMRNIARFTEAKIVGVNLNSYQIMKAQKYVDADGLGDFCSVVQCDFTHLETKLNENEYDGAFSLEAVCHAASKLECFKSVYKVLKPNATFACFEWALTSRFDPQDPVHQHAKKSIELLGGIGNLETGEQLIKTLKEAGFEVECVEDFSNLTNLYPDPWYSKFDSTASIFNFPISKTGIQILQIILKVCEFLHILPPGSAEAHKIMTAGIPGTALSGKLGIFTPHFFIKSRKICK